MNETELEKQLIETVARRYQSHAGRDLADYIFSNHLFRTFDAELIDFICACREDIHTYLSDETHRQALVTTCLWATRRFTFQRNQFINYSAAYDELVELAYRDFVLQIKNLLERAKTRAAITRAFVPLISRHHERLRLILASHCVSCHARELEGNPLLRNVPCEEYSPPFQLSLLNIDPSRLKQPVLDIGCGSGGDLVHHLRGEGITAFGIDRLAPPGDWFIQCDWFHFDYGGQAWGTLIAHQSLSTHFIYNHLLNPKAAADYARLFTKIIAGLSPGGEFYYTPGLPFFEKRLENQPGFSVFKTMISTNMPEIGEVAYAVKVRREA